MSEEEARRLLSDALEAGRIEVTRHFFDELRNDGFFFADVRHAIATIQRVVRMGQDHVGNPKFEITGLSVDGRALSLICSFKQTAAVLWITVYEGA